MKLRASTIIAISIGLVTLLGYFMPDLRLIRVQFIAWAGMLAAVAVIIGMFNLLGVHGKKIGDGTPGWPYSIVLALTLLTVLTLPALGYLGPFVPFFKDWGFGPANVGSTFVFQYVQTAIGTSLSGLIVVFLIIAGYRLTRRPMKPMLIAFLMAATISLLGLIPLPAGLPDVGLHTLGNWLAQVPAVAGARGILLGIALGVVATGLRVLLAADRPYGE